MEGVVGCAPLGISESGSRACLQKATVLCEVLQLGRSPMCYGLSTAPLGDTCSQS